MGKLTKVVLLSLTLATLQYGVVEAAGSITIPANGSHTANGETVNASGDSSPGYVVRNSATLIVNGTTNTTSTTGNRSSGVDASYGNATITANETWVITTSGYPANGIIISGGKITMADTSKVSMNIKQAGFGILSYGGTVTDLNGTLKINGTGGTSADDWGGGATAMTGILASGSGTTVNMTGTTDIDIRAEGPSTDKDHSGAANVFNHGLAATFGGVINIKGDAVTTIRTGSKYDHGIVIRRAGAINFSGNSQTTVTTGLTKGLNTGSVTDAKGAFNPMGLSAVASAAGGSVFTISENAKVKVDTYGSQAYALALANSDLVMKDNGKLTLNTHSYDDQKTAGDNGINMESVSKITMTGNSVLESTSSNNGDNSNGVQMVSNSQINVGENATFTINSKENGNNSNGINMVYGGNKINVTGGTLALNVTNSKNGVNGIRTSASTSVNDKNTISVTGGKLVIDLTNTAATTDKYGIYMQNFTTATFSGGETEITTTGDKTGGIYNNNTHNIPVTINGTAKVTVHTKDVNSVGLVTDNTYNNSYNLTHPTHTVLGGTATLNVTTDGAGSNAIETRNGAFDAGDTATLNITTKGAGSNGIVATATAKAVGTNNIGGSSTTNVTISGEEVSGIYSINSGVTNIGDNAKINITAGKAGVLTKANGLAATSQGTVNVGGNSVTTITALGESDRGLYVSNGTINLLDNANIGVTATDIDGDGVEVATDGVVALKGNAILNLTNSGERGDSFQIYGDNGTVTTEAGTTINSTVNGDMAQNIYMQGDGNQFIADGAVNFIFNGTDSAVQVNNSDGKIALNGATVITTTDKAKSALEVVGQGEITVNANGGSKVEITGNALTSGNGAGTINVNLDSANAFLAGQALGSASDSGEITFDVSNQGTWKVTKETTNNDYIDNLNLHDNGLVDLAVSGVGNYGSITVGNLTGNDGVFKLNTDLEKTKTAGAKNVLTDSDVINITGTSTGKHWIAVADKSLVTLHEVSGYLLLVHDISTDQSATFVGQDLESGGIFKYTPIIKDKDPDPAYHYSNVPTSGRNWYLTAIERSDELSDNAKTNIGLSESRYETYMNERCENDTLLKRLGELRFDGEDHGVWARMKRNKFSAEGYALRGGSATMYQVGYDKKFGTETKGVRHIGLAFSHTDSTTDLTTSAALDGSATTGTIYDTWHGNKGHYLDLVAKVGRMKGDFELTGTYPETGSSSSLFYNMSAEYGRKILVGENGWYCEPQVQFGLGRVGSDSYTSTQGNYVYFDAIDSALGRVGMNIGRNFGMTGKKSKIYASLSWNHEFGGGVNWFLADKNGDTLDDGISYGGSWWTIGIGTSMELAKKTYFYLDMEKDYGGKLTNDWLINGGFRFTW